MKQVQAVTSFVTKGFVDRNLNFEELLISVKVWLNRAMVFMHVWNNHTPYFELFSLYHSSYYNQTPDLSERN